MRYTLLFFVPVISFSSAWVREEGEFFLSPVFNYYRAKDYYDKNGNKKPIGCTFEKKELQVYGEYGLTTKATLTFKLPYDWLKCGASENSGFSDVEIGLIRQVKKGQGYSLSFYANTLIPTGYSIRDNPRLGYGRFGLEGGLLMGFSKKAGFVDSGLGYRYYFGYPSSQIRAYATAGVNLLRNLQIITTLDLQIGLGDGERKSVGQNILLEPDYKLAQVYVGPRFILGNLSFVATYQHVFWGRNTGVGRGFNLGLWWNF
ncbi:hypothetical protein [Hydrogenobacter thermophilus]|uniref:hypothetical protein n=1 Tax=Hydrogenobacter thermophilus TaxID=940 RepID=UPI0030F5F6D1